MKMVEIYDFKTKKKSTIPAAELAPGMIQAQVAGVGLVWIAASQAKLEGEFLHPPFDDEWRELLSMIKERLDAVHPMTLKQWEEGFRKDENPEQEIGIWSRIATAYQVLGSTAPAEQRREIFNLILACVNNPREHVLEVVKLEHLSRKEAQQLMDKYYSGKG